MAQFVLAIVISIVVLVVLIVKFNVHPVISLFASGMLAGTILGNDLVTSITAIASGFGSTLTSIGMTIIFGAIIACAVRDSGAAKSMVNFFIQVSSAERTLNFPPVSPLTSCPSPCSAMSPWS